MRRELQVELQAQFRAHCEGLRAQMEEEKVQAVGEACRKLREQLHKEAEETRETIIQTVRKETQVCAFWSLFVYLYNWTFGSHNIKPDKPILW